jgi:uncharacterized protein YjiS (DUF1127 family)
MQKSLVQEWARQPGQRSTRSARHHQVYSPTPPKAWPHMVRVWMARSRQRKALAELADLNDHLLRDIGVSQGEALREAEKPFWRR